MQMAYEGIRLIAFTQVEQGPVGTQVLGDFGAEVIKIEPIGTGALGRERSPQGHSVGWGFIANNRNRKSLTLDVKKPEGKEIVYQLVKVSDVIASHYRPGVMDRLGFAYEDLSKINPRLICAYAFGFGLTGPYRDRRGQDLVAQAMGGLMDLNGEGEVDIRRLQERGVVGAEYRAALAAANAPRT